MGMTSSSRVFARNAGKYVNLKWKIVIEGITFQINGVGRLNSVLLLVDVVVLTRDADIVDGVGVLSVLSMVSMESNELLYIHSFIL